MFISLIHVLGGANTQFVSPVALFNAKSRCWLSSPLAAHIHCAVGSQGQARHQRKLWSQLASLLPRGGIQYVNAAVKSGDRLLQ